MLFLSYKGMLKKLIIVENLESQIKRVEIANHKFSVDGSISTLDKF